ncbi:Concanavalin A-like lectin, partial [Candidatus Methanophagaceae archaeon]
VSTSNNAPAITPNNPPNGSSTPNNWTILNATVTDADDDPMTVYFYGKNETAGYYTLFQTNSNVANDSAVTFGWGETERTVDDSMVLLMHFNNDSAYGENDTHVYDFSGNENNGTISGATISTTGKFGKSVHFSSSDADKVSIPDSDVFGITDKMTVSAWIYPSNIVDYGRIVTKAWASSGDPWCIFSLYFDTSASSNINFLVTTNGAYSQATSTATISLNKWTYVVGTYNGSEIDIYVNGLKSGDASKTGNLNTNNQPVTIGTSSRYSNQDFEGYIDEVVMYNRSLSAEEIRNYYRLEKGKYYWQVNATDGVFSNESDVWEFKVGTGQTAPSIQLNYPDDKANLNSSTVNFNWTATDNIDDVLLCNLTIDGVVNQSNIASTSGQPTNRSVSGLSTGAHNWSVTCRNDTPTVNTSETRTFGVNDSAPNVTLNKPDNGSTTLNNWAILNATVTDANDDPMTVYFYANSNSDGLNASEGLVYIGENVANGTTLTYNLTALPTKPSEANLSLLMHFDDRSEFDEHTQRNVANAVYDFSGNGNNGTLGNATAGTAPIWNATGGKFAGAFEFDGAGDFINCGNDPLFDITNDLTVEAWVNFETTSSYYTCIAAKWCYKCGGQSYGLFKEIGAPNNFSFHIWDGSTNSNRWILSDSVFATDTWYHVVGTYNGTTMLMYMNGVQQTQTLSCGNNIATSTSPVTMGIFDNDNNFCLDGAIDEVAIYNRTLSAEEILDHYRLGGGKYYWQVNATDGVLSNESDVWNFSEFSETLEIRNQTASQSISSINFSGATGATIVDPYNIVDGSGSLQNITSKTPVVTIYNPSSSTNYKIWLKVEEVSGWSTIINDEKFNVTADDTSPGAVSSWASLISWGDYKDTGVTVSVGTYKDLYLAYELKGSGTGTSTVSVLGEAV